MRRLMDILLFRGRERARRPAVPRWMRRVVGFSAIVLALLAYGGTVSHLTKTGWVRDRTDDAKGAVFDWVAEQGFQVRSIIVVGAEQTKETDLQNAAGIERGGAILDLDLERIRSRIEALSWVRVATVERSLPDTVVLRLIERSPLALWQHDGNLRLIDETGAEIAGAPLQAFQDLPLVVGPGANKAAAQLIAALREAPEMAARVTSATFIDRRRWDLVVDDRVTVKLPRTGIAQTWIRFAREERDQRFLQRDILAVDTRNPEQWVFRLPPGARLRMAMEDRR